MRRTITRIFLSLALTFNFQLLASNCFAQLIRTIAGNGMGGYNGDSIPSTSAEVNQPVGVALDAKGNLFIADYSNNRVRRVDAVTGIITTVAGNGLDGYAGENIPAIAAEIDRPTNIALDDSGNIYIADNDNNDVRKVTAATGIITTLISGNGFSGVLGVAVDANGRNVYLSDYNNNRVMRYTPATRTLITFAGDMLYGYKGDGGVATSARLAKPYGLTIDKKGNLYIADRMNNVIRMVDTAGIIYTVAGTGNPGYNGDSIPATTAEISGPLGVSVDSIGNIYIADQGNNRIRMVDTNHLIHTIAGTGIPGYNGDGITPTLAELNNPGGIAVSSPHSFYIGEYGNNRVRQVSIHHTPGIRIKFNATDTVLCAGSCTSFADSTTGATSYRWSFPGGTPSSDTSFNPGVCYNTAGNYDVQLIASNSIGRDTLLMHHYITVNSSPSAGAIIVATKDTICTNTIIQVVDSGSSGKIQWQSASGGSYSNISGATSSFYNALLQKSTSFLTITSLGSCTDTSGALRIITLPPPSASFTYIANGLNASFNSSSTGGVTGYEWDFGDSSRFGTGASPVHHYSGTGTYDVCLTVSNNTNCNFIFCANVIISNDGLEEISSANDEWFIIFPNPGQGIYQISSGVNGGPIEAVGIYNTLGQRISRAELKTHNTNPFTIDISSLPAGIYFLTIETSQTIYKAKVVKE